MKVLSIFCASIDILERRIYTDEISSRKLTIVWKIDNDILKISISLYIDRSARIIANKLFDYNQIHSNLLGRYTVVFDIEMNYSSDNDYIEDFDWSMILFNKWSNVFVMAYEKILYFVSVLSFVFDEHYTDSIRVYDKNYVLELWQ